MIDPGKVTLCSCARAAIWPQTGHGAKLNTVVVLSPHFPPATLAGVHRARHLAKHLPAFGWQPIVLRADERHYTEALDPALASLVPNSVGQVRTQAIPAWIARLMAVGDIGLRGFNGFRGALDALAKAQPIDVVLITGSPFYPMLLARHAREHLNIPVILDFQDPWVSAEGARQRPWTKGWASHKLAVTLEPNAVRHADFITSVSERQNDEMATRYPWLDRSRLAAIPIGGDPDDFIALRRYPPTSPQVRLSPGLKHFVYVGAFLPRAAPLAHVLFRALSALRDARPGLASMLKLTFVGTSNQPSGSGGNRVKPIADSHGVGDLVDEHPPRVPFLEALSLLANADSLMMIGSDEPHYTASKIYPNLMASRPYLSIFHKASSAHAILTAAGGGSAFAFNGQAALEALVEPIKEALAKLVDHPEAFGKPNPKAYAPYTARAVAGQFADVFARVAR